MRLLVSGATVSVARLAKLRPDRVGILHTPRRCSRQEWAVGNPAAVCGADNDAFSAWSPSRFQWMLHRLKLLTLDGMPPPKFVSCPDVVGDAAETLKRFDSWEPVIRSDRLPVALVGQDGLTADAVPWDRVDAFFVGGSTAWKLGREAEAICREAKSRGKWVHMGRVNSRVRVRHAYKIGCDSFDGTSFSWFADTLIPRAIRWIDGAVADSGQVGLFDSLEEEAA